MPLLLRHDHGSLLVEIRPGTAGLATLARVEHARSCSDDEPGCVALLLAEDASPELRDALRDRDDVRFLRVADLVAGS